MITQSELSENTLCAFILLSAAAEHLNVLKAESKHIDSVLLNDMVKQLLPKINYFNKNIHSTLLADKSFKKAHENGLYEVIFETMGQMNDSLKEEIKKLV